MNFSRSYYIRILWRLSMAITEALCHAA